MEDLRFDRPEYLKTLVVLLVTLIAVSGAIALLRRNIDDLLLGIGGQLTLHFHREGTWRWPASRSSG